MTDLFKTTSITIGDKAYSILLFGDDEVWFDPTTETLYYNESIWMQGPAEPIEQLIKVGVNCIKTALKPKVFQTIIKADKQGLAQYLISQDKQERELATSLVKRFKDKDEDTMEKSPESV